MRLVWIGINQYMLIWIFDGFGEDVIHFRVGLVEFGGGVMVSISVVVVVFGAEAAAAAMLLLLFFFQT